MRSNSQLMSPKLHRKIRQKQLTDRENEDEDKVVVSLLGTLLVPKD